jgi:molybdopterin converting factor small subunit
MTPEPGAGQEGATLFVRIPAQIRRLYGAQSTEQLPAAEAPTVAQMVRALDARFPGMGERLTEPDGRLRRWVNVYVNGADVRDLAGVQTPLAPGIEVIIVPSIAGGAARGR